MATLVILISMNSRHFKLHGNIWIFFSTRYPFSDEFQWCEFFSLCMCLCRVLDINADILLQVCIPMYFILFIYNRQQRVEVSGQVSEWFVINRGVPQGSVPGPILFNLFLNGPFFSCIKCYIANYADDNHLYNANSCIKSWYVTLKTTQMFVCLGLKITVWLRILKSSKDLSHPGMVKCPFLFLLMVMPSYLQMT